jgi:hypothetical protein
MIKKDSFLNCKKLPTDIKVSDMSRLAIPAANTQDDKERFFIGLNAAEKVTQDMIVYKKTVKARMPLFLRREDGRRLVK